MTDLTPEALANQLAALIKPVEACLDLNIPVPESSVQALLATAREHADLLGAMVYLDALPEWRLEEWANSNAPERIWVRPGDVVLLAKELGWTPADPTPGPVPGEE